MTVVAIRNFRGEVPRLSGRLLPDNFAQDCTNARVSSGRLEPLRGMTQEYESSLGAEIRSMYRYTDDDQSVWMVWADPMRVVRSPGAQDVWNRVYWAGEGGPAMTANDVATSGSNPYPSQWFTLGVTPPRVGMTVTPPAVDRDATISIASPAVVTAASAHNRSAGNAVRLSTTGALPYPLRDDIDYRVLSAGLTSTALELSTTVGGAAINTSAPNVTISIASPAVVSLAAHGLPVGHAVCFNTTGALPTGLVAGTVYYVQATPTADSLTLSSTKGGAAITTTGTQSGVHSLVQSGTHTLKPQVTIETRAYVTRFVTKYGEASGPSEAALADGDATGTWTLTSLPPPPVNSGGVVSATMAGNVCTIVLDSATATYGMEPGDRLVISGTAGIAGLNAKHKIASVVSGSILRIKINSSGVAGAGTWTRENPHNLVDLKRQVFRTSGTVANYLFVGEVPATDTTFTDAVASTALGETIDSLATRTPPRNAHSIALMANGSVAVLAGNEVCISDLGLPHSFPTACRYAIPADCVDIVAVSNAIIVLTTSFPYIITADLPDSGSKAKIDNYAPCMSKEGVVDVAGGAIFPSTDGFYLASPSGVRSVTASVFKKREFDAINPKTIRASLHDQQIVACYVGPQGRAMLSFDLAEPDSVVQISREVGAMAVSEGTLYVSSGSTIYTWDSDDVNRFLAFYRSKEYQFGPPQNFAVAQIFASFGDLEDPALATKTRQANEALLTSALKPNGALCSSGLNSHSINGSAIRLVKASAVRFVQFNMRRNGSLVFSKIVQDSKPFRLPAEAKSELFTFEVASSVSVDSVTVATSMQELKAAGQ